MTDYRCFYDLEKYLLDVVRVRFAEQGFLTAPDFFCIVIWKANRAKGKIAKRLLDKAQAEQNLDDIVKELTAALQKGANPKERMRILIEDWKLRLPMASAILTVLYPEEFTVYDARVCEILDEFRHLDARVNFESKWAGYQSFKLRMIEVSPAEFSLRDKDRYLWGKSFYEQLIRNVENNFVNSSEDEE